MTIAKFVLMGGGVVLLALRLILDLSWMGFAGAILLFAGQLFFPAKPLESNAQTLFPRQ